MDQLKEFWGLFRRQHFWFILPILLVLAAYGWWTATGTVTTQVAINISTIGGYHAGADQIAGVNVEGLQHPNDEWHEVMTELIDARRTNVLSAWQKKWDRQSQILTWPADAFGPRSRDVIPRVETMRPIEEFVDEDLPSVARNDYKKFMQQQLPRIANRIGAIWDPTGQLVDGAGARVNNVDAGDDMPPGFDKPIIVSWNPESQKLIESKFDWPQYPSTMEVLYAQEDLWILGAIVDIIKTANGGARTQATAPVKEIISIKYGKDVVRNGDIDAPEAVKTGDDEDDEFVSLGDGPADPDPEPTTVDGAPTGPTHQATPRDWPLCR